MVNREIHQCKCKECQEGNEAIRKQQKYSLKANRKPVASTQHPQRDQQFRYIRRVKQLFINAGHPIISVDTKKKELIGNFKNAGQTWNQEPDLVNDHEFPSDAIAKAVPYGIYDLVHNYGCVYVGTSHDTAAFAVAAIVRWFKRKDRPKFADETKILILSDSGGSNGYRVRNWKYQLQQQLADQFKIRPPAKVRNRSTEPIHVSIFNQSFMISK